MMTKNGAGRPGWGYEDIAAAAERITARGERPKLNSVRVELGGTGSMNTIQRHLADWKKSRRPIETTSLTLPPEVQRVILGEMERGAASIRATLEVELADVQADRDTLGEENQRLATALDATEQRADEQAAEIERQAGALAQLERAFTEAKEAASREREAAEAARKAEALAGLRLESLPTLHDEIDALRVKLDAEREARRVAEIEAAELRGQHSKKG
jgi:colicin import membrane protein